MAEYIVHSKRQLTKIHKEIYGNFAEHLGRCIYEGVYVGEDSPIRNINGMRCDVVEALRHIKLPVLRWPGGCFADEYHWMDGIGEKKARKRMINTHWGGVLEDNSFGTHEFLELCAEIGCEPYINGNLGSGTVREMQEWVEYITFDGISPMADLRRANGREKPWKLTYFGVGNENWGCGGNMRAEHYADEYRRYQTYLRSFGESRLYKVACGPGCSEPDPGYEWTDTVMKIAHPYMSGLSLHYYTVPGAGWTNKGSATEFDEETYYETIRKAQFIETLMDEHARIMDQYDPGRRIGMIVDEWGTWYDVEPGTNPGFLYQQNTMRDAMVAGLTLNAFNKRAERVRMANIAQLANVLQAVVLTDGEKLLLTPTYHVFDLFKVHQDAMLLESAMEPVTRDGLAYLSESASMDEKGMLYITLTNAHATNGEPIHAKIDGFVGEVAEASIVTGDMRQKNSFDQSDVVIVPFPGIEFMQKADGLALTFTLPPVSAVRIALRARA